MVDVKVKVFFVVGEDVLNFVVGEFDFDILEYIKDVCIVVLKVGKIKYVLIFGIELF